MKPALFLKSLAIFVMAIADAEAGEIVPIPLSGFVRMSADGKWFAAQSESAIWSREQGLTNLGALPGSESSGLRGISADGSVVVGNSVLESTPGQIVRQEPFRWTRETGIVGLGTLPGSTSNLASAVSDDGTTVVGWAGGFPDPAQPWIWTQENGMVPFTLPPGATSGTLSSVSGDGSVVAGTGNQGFVWDRQNGFQFLPPGAPGERLSADGSTVVGTFSPRPNNPFRWTSQGGVTVIGPTTHFGFANDLTSNGSTIVGYLSTQTGGENFRAFVWDEQHGVQDLRSVLIRDHGFSEAELPTLYSAGQISTDAMTLTVATVFNPETTAAIYLDKPLVTLDKSEWNVDANGIWSQAANWTSALPNFAGAIAVFGKKVTQPRTITLDAPVTVGRIEFDNANGYSLAGANSITLDANFGVAKINVERGSHTISAPVMLADNATFTVTPAASNLSITGNLTSNGRNLTKAGAGTLTVNNVRSQGLAINAGTVALAPNGGAAGTSVLGGLTIAGHNDAWTAKLDLADNDSVVQSTAVNKTADFGRLHNQLKQGFNNGNWQGNGITSSAAAANTKTDTGLSASDNALLGYSTFSGQPVTADSILLKYTYYGDIDANGQVDADDLTVFANNFGRTAGATQIDGDIDFNGAVNADDLTVFANNFLKGVGNPLGAAAVHAVPEPSTLPLLVAGALGIICLWRMKKCFLSRSERAT